MVVVPMMADPFSNAATAELARAGLAVLQSAAEALREAIRMQASLRVAATRMLAHAN